MTRTSRPTPSDGKSGKRRWLQFSFRGALLVFTLVAVWIGWQANGARRQREAVEWIVSGNGEITYDWGAERERDEVRGDAKPPGPPWLRAWIGEEFFQTVHEVRLYYRRDLDEEGVATLGGLPDVRVLAITNSSLTDKGMRHLAPLRRLEELNLDRTQITDAGLRYLDGMDRLEKLNLSFPRVTGEGLAGVELENLRHLDLEGASVTDAGLEAVGQLQSLRDEGLRALAGLPRLKTLWLENTPAGDAGLRHLSQNQSLLSLDLEGSAVTDTGVSFLARMPQLRSLNLQNTDVGDDAVRHVVRLRKLTYLNLHETSITDAGLRITIVFVARSCQAALAAIVRLAEFC